MSTMLIAGNLTPESGSFMGDQLCALKLGYLFLKNEPGVDRVIMSLSRANQMHFLWEKFLKEYDVEVVWDDWDPGNWPLRFDAWDTWRRDREINGIKFDHYREMYLRIHGAQRQTVLCGFERGLGRRNIFEYWFYGQEHMPEKCVGSCDYDVTINHPPLTHDRDVYISPHCKTQGNYTFTFDFWAEVIRKLIDAGLSITLGYNGGFRDFDSSLYERFWGTFSEWRDQICRHRVVACGNTGTGWLAAACEVPLITMEPPNSQMPDHRYRECGLRNIVSMHSEPDADQVARAIIEEVRKTVVVTTGCYDVLHAGHVRHLQKSKALGTKLIVAMNSDKSIRSLKGLERPINPENQRKTVLEALRCVDEVVICDDPEDVIAKIKPDVLTNGFGYTLNTMKYKEHAKRALVTCSGDAANEPSTTKIVQKLRQTDIIEIIRAAMSFSVNPYSKLKLLADEFLKVADLPGDVADLGAYKGATSLILRRLRPDKTLHIFDTWEGNPYDDELCHHKKGEWKADLGDCKKLVPVDNTTLYYPGVFPYSVSDYLKTEYQFCFVYVDMDTYQATKDAINFFWSRMVQGGVIVFDDYGWTPCAGVKKAVDEAFTQVHIFESLYTCVVEKF